MVTATVAFVLAAGLGTRLGALTAELPKPLLPVGNRPLLGLILEKLLEQDGLRLAVNVHYKPDKIINFINGLCCDIYVSHEERVLGTAGGIARVARELGASDLVVVNGDICGELPLAALLGSACPGLTLAVVERKRGEGTVGVGEDDRVVRLRGQTFGSEAWGADYMGVAHLGSECLGSLPNEGCLIGDWALPHLRDGGTVRALAVTSDFIDIGTPADYLRANLRVVKQRGKSLIHPSATCDPGVVVRASVVGSHARVSGAGRLDRCVIFEGAVVSAPLTQAVVLASGQVVPVSLE